MEVSFKDINGVSVPKLRGGRTTKVIKDKTKYTRKTKHKGASKWQQ